jgi:hypothetical protein
MWAKALVTVAGVLAILWVNWYFLAGRKGS